MRSKILSLLALFIFLTSFETLEARRHCRTSISINCWAPAPVPCYREVYVVPHCHYPPRRVYVRQAPCCYYETVYVPCCPYYGW